MKELTIEVVKFFKNNYLKIILGTLLISVPYIWFNSTTGGSEVNNTQNESETASMVNEGESEVLETDANPASFKFFAEHEDGYPFTNNLLLFNYFITPDVMSEAEAATQTNIIDIMMKTNNEIFFSPSDSTLTGDRTKSKVFGLSKSPDTHINELYVNVGNEEDNLALVNYFYEMVMNNEVPILDNKIIYLFQEPRILDIEVREPIEEIEVATAEPFGTTVVVGVTLGLVLTIGLLVTISFFSKKLYYLFTYSIRENDSYILMDKKFDFKNDIEFLLASPAQSKNVIITEDINKIRNNELNEKVTELIKNNKLFKVNNIFEINELENIGRLVYIVEEGITDRSWYNKQRRYDEIYEYPTVIIQINKNQQNI